MTVTVIVTPRPKPLPLFYAGYGALQIGDVITTTVGLQNGAREANPVVSKFASSPVKLGLIKAGATALTIFAAESLWRSGHRKGAVAAMAAASAIAGFVLVNNLRVYRQQGR